VFRRGRHVLAGTAREREGAAGVAAPLGKERQVARCTGYTAWLGDEFGATRRSLSHDPEGGRRGSM